MGCLALPAGIRWRRILAHPPLAGEPGVRHRERGVNDRFPAARRPVGSRVPQRIEPRASAPQCALPS